MQDGMNINQATLVEVQQQKIAAAAIREVQLEAAVQQLLAENQRLTAQVEALRAEQETTAEEVTDG